MNEKARPLRRPFRADVVDEVAFPLIAGAFTLAFSLLFFSSLKLQLFYSSVRGDPALIGEWSAPLDDVFIHFDFARSAARGYPFQWLEGNGYSSGGTSLLYPFVLSLGYLTGFRGGALMEFAGIVACVSVLATLLASRRLFRDLPWWTKYLAPVLLLSIGALNWSLWSGMEVAFFLAVWGAALVAWDDLVRGVPGDDRPPALQKRAAVLGFACLLLVATRPEAAVLVAIFAISAAVAVARTHPLSRAALVLAWVAVPGALVIVSHAIANRVFTGDFSAAGALVKLELNDPKLSAEQVWDIWKFHFVYQVTRVSGYHVAGNPYVGALVFVVAAVPLFSARTRRYAALLWTSALVWVAVTALNGQVRWQNERYTMPALAWLLLSAALGLGLLCAPAEGGRRRLALSLAGASAALVFLTGLFLLQRPRFRDQVWFFGRASRNIFEQHIKVGRILRKLRPAPRRVAVGDAGAIPYESEIAALDVIGLGGYAGLPFARATRWGVASAIELIERIPVAERPDVLALYPTWWGELPIWFGRRFGGVSVRGNVICGGLTKALYQADWSPLDQSGLPATTQDTPIDALDFADVLSEREHGYSLTGAVGFVTMKILPHPKAPAEPLWDAGRILGGGARTRFTLSGFREGAPATLLLRLAPSQRSRLGISVGGAPVTAVDVEPVDRWVEAAIELPAARVSPSLDVEIHVERTEAILYHLWGLQRR